MVLVADIYAAGEAPIDGVDQHSFVAGINAHGHRNVIALPHEDQLASMIATHAKPNDLVVCLGAGSITKWANTLPEELAEVLGTKEKSVA